MNTTLPLTEAAPPETLTLLAHELRWQIVLRLAHGDRRVNELVAALARPQNLVSYHLRQLRDGGLVRERRSSYDARDIYYALDLEQLQGGFLATERAIRRARGSGNAQARRVIFLCTHNSARSQLAEAILRKEAGATVEVCSAGSEPAGVHPLALLAGDALGLDLRAHRSRHLSAYAGQAFDHVITVCDQVREVCPAFPGEPDLRHWSLPDPAAVEGSEGARLAEFVRTGLALQKRIGHFVSTM